MGRAVFYNIDPQFDLKLLNSGNLIEKLGTDLYTNNGVEPSHTLNTNICCIIHSDNIPTIAGTTFLEAITEVRDKYGKGTFFEFEGKTYSSLFYDEVQEMQESELNSINESLLVSFDHSTIEFAEAHILLEDNLSHIDNESFIIYDEDTMILEDGKNIESLIFDGIILSPEIYSTFTENNILPLYNNDNPDSIAYEAGNVFEAVDTNIFIDSQSKTEDFELLEIEVENNNLNITNQEVTIFEQDEFPSHEDDFTQDMEESDDLDSII